MDQEQLPTGTETILVVEDDSELRETVIRMLERLGYRVMPAPDPERALNLATLSPADLVLVDVVLPQMSGLTLAHKIATLRPGIRILYMSGYTTDEILDDHGDRQPGVGFLQKPFTPRQIAGAIRRLLDAAASEPVDSSPVAGGSESILVVDDDDPLRGVMARTLRRLGYRVHETGVPEAAVRIAVESSVDLVVMDVVLPGQSGLAVAHTISSQHPAVRFLYVSGFTSGEVLNGQVTEDSSDGFLDKPFTPDDLGRAVREVLDAER
jgi:CheY-like chemotaxis protein